MRVIFLSQFMPHVTCYLYNRNLILLHVVSDGLIWLSYVARVLVSGGNTMISGNYHHYQAGPMCLKIVSPSPQGLSISWPGGFTVPCEA
jgi:hypothetical protein